jgi:hypothetical protein
VHAGVAQTFSNTTPLFAKPFKMDVLGISELKAYCADPSRPWSSEIINRIFFCVVGFGTGTGTVVGSSGSVIRGTLLSLPEPQPVIIIAIVSNAKTRTSNLVIVTL